MHKYNGEKNYHVRNSTNSFISFIHPLISVYCDLCPTAKVINQFQLRALSHVYGEANCESLPSQVVTGLPTDHPFVGKNLFTANLLIDKLSPQTFGYGYRVWFCKKGVISAFAIAIAVSE